MRPQSQGESTADAYSRACREAWPAHPHAQARSEMTSSPPPASNRCSLESDPLLSLISTRLATRQDPAAPSASGPSGSASAAPGSRRLWLPAAVQQWAVRWEELSVVRAVGRGSFGRVYLATWRETPVAVKVSAAPCRVAVGSCRTEAPLPSSHCMRASSSSAEHAVPPLVSWSRPVMLAGAAGHRQRAAK